MTIRKSTTGLPKLLRRRVTTVSFQPLGDAVPNTRWLMRKSQMALWPPSLFAWLGTPPEPITKRMEVEARTMLP